MKQRIAYIDAMRGFSMFLVVYSHVLTYTFGKVASGWSLNSIISTLHIPLFFFLSGFLMYKDKQFKEWTSISNFLRNKGKVLLVPTLCFSIVFSYIMNVSCKTILLDRYKFGYWFTYTLFFYFVIYVFGDFVFGRGMKGKRKVMVGIVFSLMIYAISKYSVVPSCPWINSTVSNIIGIPNFQYFIFFFTGALVKAFFFTIDYALNREKVRMLIIIVFILLQLVLQLPFSKEKLYTEMLHPLYTILQSFAGFWGIATVLVFFHRNETRMANSRIGKFLQYIGVRTLDIYLIHSILVLTDMRFVGIFLAKNGSLILDLMLGIPVSLVIIGLCLLISEVIRCSDALAKLLFGKVIK